jgi:hypothetical protein
MKIIILTLLMTFISCQKVNLTGTAGTPDEPDLTPPPTSYDILAMGIGPGNTLVLKEIDSSTSLATTIQTYNLPSGISAFQFVKNRTRLLVELGNTINYYSFNDSVSPPTLTLLSSASVPGDPAGTWGICAAPDGSSAHLVGYTNNTIYSFKINGDTISYASTIGNAPAFLLTCKVSNDSKYLLSAGYDSGSKTFSIHPTTASLTEQTSFASNGTSWLDQSEDSQFFFITNQDYSVIQAFEMNLTNGTFALVDTKSIPLPDYIDTRENGTKIYVNCQDGQVRYMPFNRTTKQFGTETIVSNIYEWFTVGNSTPIYFQYHYSGDTTIFPLNSDGSLGTEGSTLTGESSFQILE